MYDFIIGIIYYAHGGWPVIFAEVLLYRWLEMPFPEGISLHINLSNISGMK